MQKKLLVWFAATAACTIVPAGATSAQGHESCAGGAVGASAELGLTPRPGPAFGPVVRSIATAGQAKETIAFILDAYCEEHAPGE